MDYQTYLSSREWRSRREWALERANRRCQVCNGPDELEVHHRTYANLGAELPADLTVLCAGCHRLFHGTLPEPPASFQAEPVTLAQVVEMIDAADLSTIASAKAALGGLAVAIASLPTESSRDLAAFRLCRRCDIPFHEVQRAIETNRRPAA